MDIGTDTEQYITEQYIYGFAVGPLDGSEENRQVSIMERLIQMSLQFRVILGQLCNAVGVLRTERRDKLLDGCEREKIRVLFQVWPAGETVVASNHALRVGESRSRRSSTWGKRAKSLAGIVPACWMSLRSSLACFTSFPDFVTASIFH